MAEPDAPLRSQVLERAASHSFFFRLSRAVKATAKVVGCLRVACAAGFWNACMLVFGTLLSCCRACNTAKHRGQ